ncbi:MAG: hypothetical protein Q9M97_03280 [Candidatus Gracilibacteria bacterium]|nr:hypothetical protein [Candidatus Gracilibacteria bacterium]
MLVIPAKLAKCKKIVL